MNKKMKKNADDDENYQKSMAEGTDTSELPDLVIYQILLLLPFKLAIQASLVSKQWAHVWSRSVSLADFEEDKFSCGDGSLNKLERRKFMNFLGCCLKSRKQDKHLDKFRLRMRYLGGPRIIDKWLSFAVERNVKEVHLSFRNMNRKRYLLWHTLLTAKSLTILNLEKVRIKDTTHPPISLPSLKTMSLKGVGLSKFTFSHLISGCPSIECLSLNSLTHYDGPWDLWFLKVSVSILKSLEIIKMGGVQVEAMNLESFRFFGEPKQQKDYFLREEHFNGNATCPTLRNLELFSVRHLGRWLEDLDSRFPILEHLVLHECYDEGHINIFSQYLKHIVICGIGVKTTINTPNLLSFSFDGYSLPSGFFMNAPNLSQATIILRWDSSKQAFFHTHYYTLRKFLVNFYGTSKLSLSVNYAEVIIFPAEMRTYPPPLPNLKHLHIEINSSTEVNDSVLRDSLRWMTPALEILSIKLNS